MVPGNTITKEALQHFEMAYRFMAGTLAQESQVRSRFTFKVMFFIDPN